MQEAARGYEIIGAIVVFVGSGGLLAIFGWVWRLSRDMATMQADTEKAEDRANDALNLAVATRNHLSSFELDAARRFVTDEMLTKVEERVIAAIDRLADRLDRAFEARTRGRKPTDE